MRVFLTGANGWVGSAIVRDLLEAGHSVVGLVRSTEKGEALAAAGGTPLLGSLRNLDVLRAAAAEADGIIHTAFGLDLSRIVELSAEDREAIETFGEVFAGSDRPIVVTGGLGLLPPDEVFYRGREAVPHSRFPPRVGADGLRVGQARHAGVRRAPFALDPWIGGTPRLRSHARRRSP